MKTMGMDMTTEYIIMNNTKNRVLLRGYNQRTFSGEIDNRYVNNLNPVIFKSRVSAFFSVIFSGWKYTPVTMNSDFTMPKGDFTWLKFKDERKSNLVIKVYSEDCKHTPPNSSKIYHTGKVVIKGIGDFVWSDFVEVVF